ncbi:MAG TPA: exosortase H [Thermoanaerobaculia bacterium]|nr:exosortase H [Thermoanaerobaculia bacterium]
MSRRWIFLLKFVGLLILFEVPLLIPAVDQNVVRPVSAWIAAAAAVVLRGLRQHLVVNGTVLSSSCIAVNIQNGCNGLETVLFLLAAVLAFPASAARKATAAVAGLLLIEAVNLIRVVTLYLIGCYRPQWFAAFHLAIWQTIVFATAVVFFAAWSRRAVASA